MIDNKPTKPAAVNAEDISPPENAISSESIDRTEKHNLDFSRTAESSQIEFIEDEYDEDDEPSIVPFFRSYDYSVIKRDMTQKAIVSYVLPVDSDLLFDESKSVLLCGRFSDDGRTFCVEDDTPTQLILRRSHMNKKFQGMLKHLSGIEEHFWIVGDATDDTIRIRGIHIARKRLSLWELNRGKTPAAIDDESLQAIISRLFSAPFVECANVPAKTGVDFSFSNEAQLKLLFNSCRSSYPKSISDWAEETLHNIDAGFYSAETRQHAVKSLALVLNVDWSGKVKTPPPLPQIREKLNKRFYAMNEIKEAILDAAAYIRQTGNSPQWGILLVGPPGTGKTALAKAVAEILEQPFGSLDFSVETGFEALCGSSRVFSNAKIGHVFEQIFSSRSGNMVMLLNEIDKCEKGQNKDATNVLLSLLDGHGYTDQYLQCCVPTDGIFCIATANDISGLSPILLSRLRVIELPPYSLEEKHKIFSDYIFPRACERASLSVGELRLSASAQEAVVRSYAAASGVRDLEQAAERLVEYYLKQKESEKCSSEVYHKSDMTRILGRAEEDRPTIQDIGEAIGVYQTGGESHLFKIQVSVQPGTGNVKAINIGNSQFPYCLGAYEAVKQFIHEDMSAYDVVIYSEKKLPELEYNYIGMPVCAALYSALKEIMLSDTEILAGGCDLFGNICLYRQKITYAMRKIEGVGKEYVLYSASGAMRLCNESHRGVCVVELRNIQQLFSMMDLRKKRQQ